MCITASNTSGANELTYESKTSVDDSMTYSVEIGGQSTYANMNGDINYVVGGTKTGNETKLQQMAQLSNSQGGNTIQARTIGLGIHYIFQAFPTSSATVTTSSFVNGTMFDANAEYQMAGGNFHESAVSRKAIGLDIYNWGSGNATGQTHLQFVPIPEVPENWLPSCIDDAPLIFKNDTVYIGQLGNNLSGEMQK